MQVTVQKIWPLDPTKNSGGFKGTDGVNYYCEIGAYNLLQEGLTYEANARPYTSKSGKSSFIMPKEWHPPATIVGGNAAPPPERTAAPTQATRPAANSAPPPYFSEVEKSGYIFVTGCLQQALGSGKIEAKDIPFVAETLVAAWNDHIKGKI
jgi:hypothetical protein